MDLPRKAPDTSPEPDDVSWDDERMGNENEDDESPDPDGEFVGEEPPPRPRRRYWEAHGLAELALGEFRVEYHRPSGTWRRREAIRGKRLHNAAVHPLTGDLLRGAEHAPLLYADDPRTNVPSALEQRVVETIRGRDGDIVLGWLRQR